MEDLSEQQCLMLILQNLSPGGLLDSSSMLPSEGIVSDTIVMDATAVLSADGEVLSLSENVSPFFCLVFIVLM